MSHGTIVMRSSAEGSEVDGLSDPGSYPVLADALRAAGLSASLVERLVRGNATAFLRRAFPAS